MKPADWIDHADRLLGAAVVTDVDIRRAVSASYYAAFHAVGELVVQALASGTGGPQVQTALHRGVDHRQLRTLCEELMKSNVSRRFRAYWPAAGFGAELRAAASTIVALQDERHRADYDPSYEPSAFQAADAVAASLGVLAALERVPEPAKSMFAVLNVIRLRDRS